MHAGLKAALPATLLRAGGHRDDKRPVSAAQVADLGGEEERVLVAEEHVKEDEIKGRSRGPEQARAEVAGADGGNVAAQILQQLLRNRSVHVVAVREQNS